MKLIMKPTQVTLIHYGSSKYAPELFCSIGDVPFFVKPHGGLWASPVNSNWGWKEWCEAEEYGSLNESFKFEFSGRLLVIDTITDLDKLAWIETSSCHFITFQAMCLGGAFLYDAIMLTEKGERETRFSRPRSLYGWDCECVLILNPETITPL